MQKRDPVWLDAQYNNRARIPEHARIFKRWAAASASARAKLRCHVDVPYGIRPLEMLDVFPASGEAAPVLLFIHGGYRRALDKRDQSFIAPTFVRAGATVVLPNYSLCPSVGIEDIALEMTRAVAWTWRHAADYAIDPNRIVVAGHSAGGHLAAMLLCC